jgi:glutathione S-transferase
MSLYLVSDLNLKFYNLPREIDQFRLLFVFQCWPALRKAFSGEEKGCEKAVEEASEVLKFLEKELKEKRFFGGESIGMVDIAANIIGGWLGACEEATGVEFFTREKFPKLSNWIDEFVSNSVIKENLPPRDKLVPFLRYRFESVNASK